MNASRETYDNADHLAILELDGWIEFTIVPASTVDTNSTCNVQGCQPPDPNAHWWCVLL
jgi:hypothetical protein